MTPEELQQLERELASIGRLGPGYVCLPWRETLAMARVRVRVRGRRFKVWGYKMHNADGTHTWAYQYGPYAEGTARAQFQMGCTSCGLVGQARVHCENPYHATRRARLDFIDMYGEEGTLEVGGVSTRVRITA